MSRYTRAVTRAHAKINLALNITGTAANGYHMLETVMQSVALCDVVTVHLLPTPGIRLICSDPSIPRDESNTAMKAVRVFFTHTGLPETGLDIHIEKSIPTEAGLGGGSADAAAVLIALDTLFKTNLTSQQLSALGALVGADVPFCLTGGTALATGIGDILEPLPPLPDCPILLVKPPQGVSTKEAYRAYDDSTQKPAPSDIPALCSALARGDLVAIGQNMGNVFQSLPVPAEVPRAMHILQEHSAYGAAMSGSGSAVAGLFPKGRDLTACANQLHAEVGVVRQVSPTDRGIVCLSLE